jgi:hypothetical protein
MNEKMQAENNFFKMSLQKSVSIPTKLKMFIGVSDKEFKNRE